MWSMVMDPEEPDLEEGVTAHGSVLPMQGRIGTGSSARSFPVLTVL